MIRDCLSIIFPYLNYIHDREYLSLISRGDREFIMRIWKRNNFQHKFLEYLSKYYLNARRFCSIIKRMGAWVSGSTLLEILGYIPQGQSNDFDVFLDKKEVDMNEYAYDSVGKFSMKNKIGIEAWLYHIRKFDQVKNAESRYADLGYWYIREYTKNGLKIQIIRTRNGQSPYERTSCFDLSLNRCWFDGENLHIPPEIKDHLDRRVFTVLEKSRNNKKTMDRIEKYKKRGFTLIN